MKGFLSIFMMLMIAFSSFGLNTPNFIQEQDESQSIAISDTMDYVDESINFTVENATVVFPYDTGFPVMANSVGTDNIKPALKLIPTSGKNANNGHLNKKYDPGSCY